MHTTITTVTTVTNRLLMGIPVVTVLLAYRHRTVSARNALVKLISATG